MLSINDVVIAVLCSALLIFLIRAFPFLLFSKIKMPKIFLFMEQYMPSLIMTILIIYCLRNSQLSGSLNLFPAVISLIFAATIHLLKNNALISILSSTALFMFLKQTLL